VDNTLKSPSIAAQCRMLAINRSCYYRKSKEINPEDLKLMHAMDRMYTEDPTRGTRRYRDDLALDGHKAGRDKVRRLMRLMAIAAVYCKPRTTVSDPGKYKYPYLLRGMDINRANQVWQIDISYVPLRRGFLYLVAIIDVHSRYIVGWDISNTMEAEWVVGCIKFKSRPRMLPFTGKKRDHFKKAAHIKELLDCPWAQTTEHQFTGFSLL